jgi:hypothetical protein
MIAPAHYAYGYENGEPKKKPDNDAAKYAGPGIGCCPGCGANVKLRRFGKIWKIGSHPSTDFSRRGVTKPCGGSGKFPK